MKKSFAILCSFAFLALLTPSVIKAESLVIPNVYIKDIKLESSTLVPGQVVKGTFNTLSDTTSVASDIYFKISLVGGYQKNTLASKWYDTTTINSPFEIKAGETKPVAFSYTIPQVKAGTGYGIQIQAMTHAGIPLGWSDAYVKVSAGDAKTQLLDILSAKLMVGKDSFALQEGPTVPEGKSAIFAVTIKNATSQSVTLTPTIDLYNHVVLGTPLSTTKATAVTIAAGAQKQFLIPLPTNNNQPLVYVSHVSFLDANSVSRVTPLDVRYIVAGDIATIQTLSTDKKSFNKGDAVSVTLGFSGTPFDITTGKNQATAIYNTTVNLLNSQNIIIGTASAVIDYNATGTKTLAIKTTDKANGYTVDVNVTKGGKVITHYSALISPETNTTSNTNPISGVNWYLTLYGLVLGLIIVAIIFLMQKKNKLGVILLAVLLLGGLVYVIFNYGDIRKAGATVTASMSNVVVSPPSTNAGNISVSWSYPYPYQVLTFPNNLIPVQGTIFATACTNSAHYVYARATLVNSSNVVIQDTGSVLLLSEGGIGGDHNSYPLGGVQYSFNLLVPTTTPGTYTIKVDAQMNWMQNGVVINTSTWHGEQAVYVIDPLTTYCEPANTSRWYSKAWSVQINGGAGFGAGNGFNYYYKWTGEGINFSTSTTNNTITPPLFVDYSSAGLKTATVVVSDGVSSITKTCSEPIVAPPNLMSCETDGSVHVLGSPTATAQWFVKNLYPSTSTPAYLWSGTDGLTGTAYNVFKTYNTEGVKTASVKVTYGAQQPIIVSCPNINIYSNIKVSCSAVRTGNTVTWTATPFGGIPTAYLANTYTWTGDVTGTTAGNTTSISKTYADNTTTRSAVVRLDGFPGIFATSSCSTVVASPITSSCLVNGATQPVSAKIGDTVLWSTSVSGGNGNYIYSWDGIDSIYNPVTRINSTTSKTYDSVATTTATVTIGSPGTPPVTINCPTVTVTNLAFSCSVNGSPNNITVNSGNFVTWTVSSVGGSGTYNYLWSGTDGLTGTNNSITTSYASNGVKTGAVTVTGAGLGSFVVPCPNVTVGTAVIATSALTSLYGPTAKPGGSAVLNSIASNVSGCNLSGGNIGGLLLTVSGNSVNQNTNATGIMATTTFTLRCVRASGVTANPSDKTVDIGPAVPPTGGTISCHPTSNGSTIISSSNVGQLIKWVVENGAAASTYSWVDGGVPVTSVTGSTYEHRYSTVGKKTVSVIETLTTGGSSPLTTCTTTSANYLQVVSGGTIYPY